MPSTDPVTSWLELLKAGDHAAAQPLWERFYQKMVALARKRLRSCPRRAADQEDVALSAFDSFCRGAEQGRFPQLTDRDSLWAHLIILVIRKAYRLIQRERRQKRGSGKVLDEAALDNGDGESGLEQVIGREPTPLLAAQVVEQFRHLLDQLPNDGQRQVAQWKLEGYTNDEIAKMLGCAPRTVERKLKLIRKRLKEFEP